MVVKWEAEGMKCHLCPRCEALETDQSEADVIEATFKKPMEHKKIRVQRNKEAVEKQEHEEKLTGAGGHGQQVREGELAQEHEEVIELAGEQR